MVSFLSRQLGRPEGMVGGLLLKLLNRVNAEMNQAVLADLAPIRGDRVLEIGFGGGDLMAALLRAPVAGVTGVEVSGPALAGARRRFAAEIGAGRLTLIEAGVEALPVETGAVDRLYSCNTLYFWPDLERPLAEMARVLRPGGGLALGHVRRPPSGTVHRESEAIQAALAAAGFVSLRSRPVRDAFTVTTAVRG